MMAVSVITCAVIILDQLSKQWAIHFLQPIDEIPIIKNILYFKYTTNDGMAFGLLSEHRWIFILLTSLIIAVIFAFLYRTRGKRKHFLLSSSLALILGGGIGNMIDRVFYGDKLFCGSVVDFIDFRAINFAVFNLADSAVCVGEALLILYVLFVDSKLGQECFSFSSCDKSSSKNARSTGKEQ